MNTVLATACGVNPFIYICTPGMVGYVREGWGRIVVETG